MTEDALSDVLRRIHLQGTLLFHVSAMPPWVVEAPRAAGIPPSVMPGAGHVMAYHVVTSGCCWGAVVGEAPVRAEQGDVLVFAHGDGHVLSSAPGMRAHYAINPFLLGPSQRPTFFLEVRGNEVAAAAGEGGSARGDTALLCGFFGCDAQPFNPLLLNLPRLLHIRHRDDGDASLTAQFIRTATRESGAARLGGAAVLERLSEMMFVDLVRRYLDGLPSAQAGWLAGLRDRHVGRALGMLHARPAQRWSAELLAERVGVSRSTLYERFEHYLGLAPMHYLTRWRMQLAAGLLVRTEASVLAVALEVGYESEPAFTRAFKKATGVPPGEWRRRRGA